MKFVWILLIWTILFQLGRAQEFYHFKGSGSGIEWQNIIMTHGSVDSIMTALIKSNALTSYNRVDDSTLIGEITNVKSNCEGTKSVHSWATRTAYTNGSLFGTAKIEIKQNKYRVTIYGLTIDPRLNFGDDENKEAFEGWYWNKGKNTFKTGNYRDDDLICFDNSLTIQFTLKQNKDW